MFYALEAFSCFDKNYETGDPINPSELGPYVSNLLEAKVISLDAPTTIKKKEKAPKDFTPEV